MLPTCLSPCSPCPASCPPAAGAEAVEQLARRRPAALSAAHRPTSAHRPVAVSPLYPLRKITLIYFIPRTHHHVNQLLSLANIIFIFNIINHIRGPDSLGLKN